MNIIGKLSRSSGLSFIIQIALLGCFSRLVFIVAILGLLSLNDYFTIPSQVSSLLPLGALLLGLIVIVTFAETLSKRIIHRVISRLAEIQSIFGLGSETLHHEYGPMALQRNYLETVFFPFITSVLPAPLVLAVLLNIAPQLIIISIFQWIANCCIIFYFNRINTNESDVKNPENSSIQGIDDSNSYIHILRQVSSSSQLQPTDSLSKDNQNFNRIKIDKRDALRTSNLVFRGLILFSSALLAIYKITSLGSIVGFFVLNNTLRYAMVVLAEYLWPSVRPLAFQQVCVQIALAFSPESLMLEQLEDLQIRERMRHNKFDELMAKRLSLVPFLRFKDFTVAHSDAHQSRLIDDMTARIELESINVIHVCSSKLCRELTTILQDKEQSSMPLVIKGIVVCAQLPIDAFIWKHLPLANPHRCSLYSTSLDYHFAPKQRSLVSNLISRHELKRFYLEDDLEPFSVKQLSTRQLRRMRALVVLIDLILQPHCLWIAPFVLDPFEESEALQLLHIYKNEASKAQRTLFLVSRALPIINGFRYYDLSRTSLKTIS
jgi:hypothetical protein